MSRFDDRWKRIISAARRAPSRDLPSVPDGGELLAHASRPRADWERSWESLTAAARRAPERPLPAVPDIRLPPRRAVDPSAGWEWWSVRVLGSAAAAAIVLGLSVAGADLSGTRRLDWSHLDPQLLVQTLPALPSVQLPTPPSLPHLPVPPHLSVPFSLPGFGTTTP